MRASSMKKKAVMRTTDLKENFTFTMP